MLYLLAEATTGESSESTKITIPQEQAEAVKKLMQFDFDLTSDQWLSLAQYYGLRVALVLVLLTLAWTLAGWASSMVRAGLRRLKFDETLTLFIAKLTWWGIILLAALACMSKFGIETTSFAAVIGAAGFAVGLAFQGTLSNFAAGAMLLVFRPYRVGDVVNVADNLGKVDEIELFTTTIDTFDNRRIIIPNSSIYGSVIENITFHRKRRIDVDVGVSYSADIDETRRVLTEAANATEGTLPDTEPAIVLLGLGASSVDWSVRVWGPTDKYLDVKQVLIRHVKMHLDSAGIEIPFPQMDIHLDRSK
ncbi:mechanosensitive ion channel family protein [Aeoliella mucimassa]|uniref:Small-conductance mechanosensitive channel n=1 Tax=Aeoliella mucimassa TaxID=2527972 RepID=A0A518AUU0_9BACT|nr:mechanosensitive ion channel domain-containing protein [Aeoliella mucimassa]QDU58487.1 Small-conductance mechanosensitive channel [Aeoliella mucimassa]